MDAGADIVGKSACGWHRGLLIEYMLDVMKLVVR
jgi:hypothetical protein